MHISQLEGRRVALWGWGREGRAAWRAIRARLPGLPLSLFCDRAEAADAAALGDPLLSAGLQPTAEALAAFDVVVKSPGISPYRPAAAAAAGTAPASSATPVPTADSANAVSPRASRLDLISSSSIGEQSS